MRPTSTSTMLQQNNNNNYPCLNVSGSTREMLQKSLPFPSRLELGLGDLPLIRGLRAWALCSKNRRKPGGFLGGGQAPTAPPLNRGGSAPCTRPADVYLSEEWGRSMGYGLPLGLDAGHGQAGIGALVTVATLKTSEGSGKTQTQCLFLRTEKGSCLYSTAKPGSGSTNSSVVGGWLRGKTGGGRGSDTPGGRRDNGLNPPPPQTGANRVRVRSGRRWRKSCNSTAGREKAGVSRERRQSSGREDPAGETPLEERQEEPDKGGREGGGLESERFPSPGQQDNRKAKQEKGEGACRSPKCCHNASPKTCMRCGEKAQMGASQKDESLRRGVSKWPDSEVKGMRKERQKNEEKALESSNSVLALPNPDLESKHFHTESHGEEIRGDESNKQPTKQPSHSKDDRSEKGDDTNSVVMETRTGGKDLSGQVTDDFTSQLNSDIDYRKPCGETAANGNGFSDHVGADQGAEKETEREDGSINQTPAEFYYEGFRVSTCPAASSESSAAVGGSTCNDEHDTCKDDHLDLNHQQWVAESGINGKEEVEDSRFENPNCVADENKTFFFKNVEEREALSSPLQHSDTPFFETDGRIITENCCYFSKTELREESVCENREEEAHNIERVNSEEAGNIQRRKFTPKELDGSGKGRHTEGILNDRTTQEYVERDCAVNYKCRLQEKYAGDTCEQTSFTHVEANVETNTNVINVPYSEPPTTSAPPSLANPAPSLPPLGSMATGQPCLEAEKENENVKEVEGFGRDANGGRIGKRELEEQRGSTVATEDQEDEFGVFMQAEGEGSTMSASVSCGSRESAAAALENHTISGESTHWTPGWTDSSFHQSDDSWTAFPQDSTDEAPDAPGQWWPTSALDESRDRLAFVFAEAFPSLPGSPSTDLDTVPTLTQLLRGRASQDQGLLDSFHDLNKMICQRYKRANGVSRDLLLKMLHLEQPHTECRPAPRTSNRRLSPGLPSANQHAQNAGAKRRLSYDYNRNIME